MTFPATPCSEKSVVISCEPHCERSEIPHRPLPCSSKDIHTLLEENRQLRKVNAELSARIMAEQKPGETLQAMEVVCQRIARYMINLEHQNEYLQKQLDSKEREIETLKSLMRNSLKSIVDDLNQKLLKTFSAEIPDFEKMVNQSLRADGTVDIKELVRKIEISKFGESSDEWQLISPEANSTEGTQSKSWTLPSEIDTDSGEFIHQTIIVDDCEPSELARLIEELRILQKHYGESEEMRTITAEDLVDENGKKMTKTEALYKLWDCLGLAAKGVYYTGKGAIFVLSLIFKLSPLIGIGLLFTKTSIPLMLFELI